MLSSSRSSARRAVLRARHFATAVDVAGIRVAAVDHGQPSASVTVLVKAGTRYESKPGAAGLLKNFAFKSTTEKSALRVARETEHFGGVLSASLGREHLALTAEFLKGDEAYFVDLLSNVLTKTKFVRHELAESVGPATVVEAETASADPASAALDAAHALAFRNGLGASLLGSPSHLNVEDIKAFASNAFSKQNVAVFGTGIDQEVLTKLVEKSLASLPATGAASSTTPSTYFGGESRIAASSHGHGPAVQTIFVGFGTTTPDYTHLQTLKALLSPEPHLPWIKNSSTSTLFESLPPSATVTPVLLPYSDAALFGVLVQAPTTQDVHAAGKVAVQALKAAGASGSFKAEDVKKAVQKAKFALAQSAESRDGLLSAVTHHLLGGSATTLESSFQGLEKVTATAVAKTASGLLKSKPVFVAVGDIQSLPYADELGL